MVLFILFLQLVESHLFKLLPEDITAETAILKGQIIGTGDSSITERGHYWSTDQNNIEQNTSLSSDQLEFSSTISNLNPETTYYMRMLLIALVHR